VARSAVLPRTLPNGAAPQRGRHVAASRARHEEYSTPCHLCRAILHRRKAAGRVRGVHKRHAGDAAHGKYRQQCRSRQRRAAAAHTPAPAASSPQRAPHARLPSPHRRQQRRRQRSAADARAKWKRGPAGRRSVQHASASAASSATMPPEAANRQRQQSPCRRIAVGRFAPRQAQASPAMACAAGSLRSSACKSATAVPYALPPVIVRVAQRGTKMPDAQRGHLRRQQPTRRSPRRRSLDLQSARQASMAKARRTLYAARYIAGMVAWPIAARRQCRADV